jgi:hypothetical protein
MKKLHFTLSNLTFMCYLFVFRVHLSSQDLDEIITEHLIAGHGGHMKRRVTLWYVE